jgi:spore germination protein GerM
VSRRLLAAILASLLAAVTACSVPRDDEARIVTNPAPENDVSPTRRVGQRMSAKLYFVRTSDNKLEAITTSVLMQENGDPPGPYELLEALISDGPPPEEQRLESKIPRNIRYEVRAGSVQDEVIVILPDLQPKQLNRDTLILAFQQIVFTLTELPYVNSVRFSVGNKLFPVPLRSGGDVVDRGVRRLPDYDDDTIFVPTTTTLPPPSTTLAPPSSAPTGSGGPGPSAPGASTPGASVPAASAPPASSAPAGNA